MKNYIIYFCLLLSAFKGYSQDCGPGDPGGQPGCPDPSGGCPPPGGAPISIPVGGSGDPNEIIGPSGYDTLKWVSVKQTLPYKILFENDPKIATAPAQLIKIVLPIHAKLNPSSIRIGDFGFRNLDFNVPPNTSIYSNRLDVRDSLGVYVDVTAGFDVARREAFWIFQAIDPATGLAATLDPLKGVLPVNDSLSHNGEGYITFTVIPSALAQTRDTLTAQASIIFDTEDIIKTNKWINTIDAVAPVSAISALPAVVDSVFNVSWTGEDDPNGSGVKDYMLYVSKNNGPFTLYKDKLTITSEDVSGQKGNKFSFYTRAADNAGNLEANKAVGDKVVTINVPGLNKTCIGASILFAVDSPSSGSSYQWQVNSGSGFTDISNDDKYSGVSTAQLTISEVPESYRGYLYRARITNGANSSYDSERKLSFVSTWLGITGESWHNPANWSCGVVPDVTTDVIIPRDVPASPVITAAAKCFSLTMNKQSAITIKNGFKLEIIGK